MASYTGMSNLQNHPHRSGFDIGRKNAFTAKVGELLPVYWDISMRIISGKIVDFWNRYDYNRLVDFYQTLEDSNDKDLIDFELRNYSFRYDRSSRDKIKPYHELPLVRRLAAASLMKCRDKVKHKKVNDLFGIFSYHD